MTKTFVFDTNCLVSASILPKSTSRLAFNEAVLSGRIAASDAVIDEYMQVIFRKKFDKYFIADEERLFVINLVMTKIKIFTPAETITACRDPKDNKFLELAVAANAACIITGDNDLHILHPFRGIPILSPVDFIDKF